MLSFSEFNVKDTKIKRADQTELKSLWFLLNSTNHSGCSINPATGWMRGGWGRGVKQGRDSGPGQPTE